jgi:hypothetical protein
MVFPGSPARTPPREGDPLAVHASARVANPCLHHESVVRADSVTCGERWKSAADLWIPFLVDSRRYLSIFDVVRDRCGIKGVAEATTTSTSVFGRLGRAEGVREQVLA